MSCYFLYCFPFDFILFAPYACCFLISFSRYQQTFFKVIVSTYTSRLLHILAIIVSVSFSSFYWVYKIPYYISIPYAWFHSFLISVLPGQSWCLFIKGNFYNHFEMYKISMLRFLFRILLNLIHWCELVALQYWAFWLRTRLLLCPPVNLRCLLCPIVEVCGSFM